MMVVVPWQQQDWQTSSEMGGKLVKRIALCEERVSEEVTSFTMHYSVFFFFKPFLTMFFKMQNFVQTSV